MQIENTNKNKASLEDVRLGLQFRKIRPSVRTIMQEFSLGQRRAQILTHWSRRLALAGRGNATFPPETR